MDKVHQVGTSSAQRNPCSSMDKVNQVGTSSAQRAEA